MIESPILVEDKTLEKVEELKQGSKNPLEGLMTGIDDKLKILIALIIAVSIYLYSTNKLDLQTILMYFAGIVIFMFFSKGTKSTTELLSEEECKAILYKILKKKQSFTTEIPPGDIIMGLATVQRSFNKVLEYTREIGFTIRRIDNREEDWICVFDSRLPGKVISFKKKRFGYTGDEVKDVIFGYNPFNIKTQNSKDLVERFPDMREGLEW